MFFIYHFFFSHFPDEKNENKKNDNNLLESPADIENDKRPPLEKFRSGYLWVSDLTRQNWCEQQMWYSFTLPVVEEETQVMTEGSNLHLARGKFSHTSRKHAYLKLIP